MGNLQTQDLDDMAQRFFAAELSINPIAEQYSRKEICEFLRISIDELERIVEEMTPAQLEYRLPGGPTGPDSSGDEEHFDTSQIVTHVAAAIPYHWRGIAKALGHERPTFLAPPEGARTTGTKGNIMGSGGWAGLPVPDLVKILRDTGEHFLDYMESLPEDVDDQATSAYLSLGSRVDLTARAWLLLDAVHVAMHAKQIRDMQTQPDYPRA